MTKRDTSHVILLPPFTLACLHCGSRYELATPAPIHVAAGASKGFSKQHNGCRLGPEGRACSHCFGFGHVETACPRTQYRGNVAAWVRGPDTGLSSLAICGVLTGMGGGDVASYPHDPADFGRCHRFLAAFPALRARIGEMAGVSDVWARLVSAWDEMEALYLEEFPSGKAPKLYARMQQLIGGR